MQENKEARALVYQRYQENKEARALVYQGYQENKEVRALVYQGYQENKEVRALVQQVGMRITVVLFKILYLLPRGSGGAAAPPGEFLFHEGHKPCSNWLAMSMGLSGALKSDGVIRARLSWINQNSQNILQFALSGFIRTK